VLDFPKRMLELNSPRKVSVTNKFLAAGSVALMGAGSLLGAATAANAFTAAECDGEFEAGYWNYTEGYCEVGFGTAGEHSWTTPAKYSELWVLLVGGGGGASGDTEFDNGYAGGGGDVQFFDLSDLAPGTELTLQTGAGGESVADSTNFASDGEDSWVESTTETWNAQGGLGNSGAGGQWLWGYCSAWGYVGQGPSYFDDGIPVPADLPCDTGAPGYVPSEESDTPAIFDDINYELGAGGDVVVEGYGYSPGVGAHVFSDVDLNTVGLNEYGQDGLVVFRWIPTGALASTGVDAAPMSVLAAGMLVAGGVGLAIARRSRRSQ